MGALAALQMPERRFKVIELHDEEETNFGKRYRIECYAEMLRRLLSVFITPMPEGLPHRDVGPKI